MKRILLAGASLAIAVTCNAQTITTYAGSGTAGYAGDGGLATVANLNQPWGITVDGGGNLYIADVTNSRIRKVNPAGTITTVGGNGSATYSGDGGPATAAGISVKGVAVDGSGNIYFTDIMANRIRKISSSGIVSTIAGNGTIGYSGDGGLAATAQLHFPTSIAVDASGNVYFTDDANHCVRKISTSGILSTIAGSGTSGFSGDGGSATLAKLSSPSGVAVDGSGNIYIADYSNYRVRKVTPAGIITTCAGNGGSGDLGDGGLATTAEMNYVYGIAVDGSGNLYIADADHNVIRKVNTSGIITTVAGSAMGGYSGDGGPATAAKLYEPWGVTIGASGKMFIADGYNNRIRMVTPGTSGFEEEALHSNIQVYPNPSSADAKISYELPGNIFQGEIIICNAAGQKINSYPVEKGSGNIGIDNSLLPAGVYYYMLRSDGPESTFKKMIITK
jgi:sugar lactone lactonase YvrE